MDNLQIEGKQHTYSIYRCVYAPVVSNMYIIIEGKEAIIIDSNVSNDAHCLLKEKKIEQIHLFLPHEHYDHSCGVCWFKEKFNTTFYCYENSKDALSTKKNCSPRLVAFVLSTMDMNDNGNRYENFKSEMIDYTLVPDVYFQDLQILNIAGHIIQIIHAPGHTLGSCLLIMDDELVFSGDSLIEGNKIITSFRGGNKKNMLNITLPKLKTLPDDLMVMPGHGNPFKKKNYNFNIYNV